MHDLIIDGEMDIGEVTHTEKISGGIPGFVPSDSTSVVADRDIFDAN